MLSLCLKSHETVYSFQKPGIHILHTQLIDEASLKPAPQKITQPKPKPPPPPKKQIIPHRAPIAKKAIILQKPKVKPHKTLDDEITQEQKALEQLNNRLQSALQAEVKKQQQMAAQQQQMDGYKAQILSLIQSHWRIHELNKNLSCVYRIEIAPGGMVLSVTLVKSSGNTALDQSAKVAILQSSPLPVPNDPALFESFRELVLTVSPKSFV
jgi:colicin import membrane protein